MAIKQSSGYCHHCQQPRPFAKNAPNHILHFVVTLFTIGLWSPVWLIVTVKAAGSSAMCTACGMAKGSGAPREIKKASTSETTWAAGWYPDADDPTRQRYWDGAQWTEHRTPTPDTSQAPASELDAATTEGPRTKDDAAGEPQPDARS
jgi:hypothetical protein